MEPQKNTTPAANGDEQETTPNTAAQAVVPDAGLPQAPSTSTDDVGMGDEAPATPPATDDTSASVDADPMPSPSPSDEVNATPALDPSPEVQAGLASEAPATPSSADSGMPSPTLSPTEPAPASGLPEMPVTPADVSVIPGLGDASNPVDQGQVAPAVAPVATMRNDKKTIFVLLAVAVVLIAAIAVLYFL